MSKTTLALYDDLAAAQQAMQALKENGFPPEDISLIAADAHGDYGRQVAAGQPLTPGGYGAVSEGAAAEAGRGAVIGGIAGLIIGLASLVIPGVGPVIAGGWLATTIAGAGIGAASGGLSGALGEAGVPEGEAKSYSEAVRRGGNLVAVMSSDEMAERAAEVLGRFLPQGVEQQPADAEDLGADPVKTGRGDMELERARYGQVMSFPARQSRETPESDLSDESGMGDQQLVMGALDGGAIQYGIDTREAAQPDPRAQRELTEEQQHAAELASFERFERFMPTFRNHYDETYTTSAHTFDEFLPAYRYGYDLAISDRFRDKRWEQAETEAQASWEQTNPQSGWDEYRDAVHAGWWAARESSGA